MQLKPHEFWELTYAELIDMLDGYRKSLIRKRNEITYSAWNTVNFSRYDQLPELSSLMQDESKEEDHEQTPEEMLAALKLINAAYGGIVVEV